MVKASSYFYADEARTSVFATITAKMSNGMLQPQIFESLQQKIDEDTAVRDVRILLYLQPRSRVLIADSTR